MTAGRLFNDPDQFARPKKRAACTRVQALAIYQLYPRHIQREAAIRAIIHAAVRVKAEGVEPLPYLTERTTAYAASPAGQKGQFTPHPATWFNAGGYDDDPAEWQRVDDNGQAGGACKWQAGLDEHLKGLEDEG